MVLDTRAVAIVVVQVPLTVMACMRTLFHVRYIFFLCVRFSNLKICFAMLLVYFEYGMFDIPCRIIKTWLMPGGGGWCHSFN
jgi:hypothetical protein